MTNSINSCFLEIYIECMLSAYFRNECTSTNLLQILQITFAPEALLLWYEEA